MIDKILEKNYEQILGFTRSESVFVGRAASQYVFCKETWDRIEAESDMNYLLELTIEVKSKKDVYSGRP